MTTLILVPQRLTGKEQALIDALGKPDNLIVPVVYTDGTLNMTGTANRIKEQCEQIARYNPGLKVNLVLVGDSEKNPGDTWEIKNTLVRYGIYMARLVCTRTNIVLVCVLAANGRITWLHYATIDQSQLASEWHELHPEVIL